MTSIINLISKSLNKKFWLNIFGDRNLRDNIKLNHTFKEEKYFITIIGNIK